jgi:hypothetical protein
VGAARDAARGNRAATIVAAPARLDACERLG